MGYRCSECDGYVCELGEIATGEEECHCFCPNCKEKDAEIERLKKDGQSFNKVFERIARAVGIETSLQLTAIAENDEETTAELLAKYIEQQTFTVSQERVKVLEGKLTTVRDAIAQAPEDAFGSVPETPTHEGWWVRDELVDSLTAALLQKEE